MESDGSHIMLQLLTLLMLILLNAFFASAEIALISLNDKKIRKMAEEGHKKAKLIDKLISEPSRFLSTIQVGVTLSGLFASALASKTFADKLTAWIVSMHPLVDMDFIAGVSLISITLLLSYFTLVLGELVPKRLAMLNPEKISMFCVHPLRLISIITAPFIKLLSLSTNFILMVLGIDPKITNENVTEEEIRLLVDVGEENGVIPESERIMINNIFEFDDTTVERIMTHRTDIVALPFDASFDEVVNVVIAEKYSRIPVYEGTLDHITGILHTKDMLEYIKDKNAKEFQLSDVVHEPYFVPQSKMADELLTELQLHKNHMAVVVDEYGGTAGIITLEDLVELIVGNIQDEYDDEEQELWQIDEDTYILDGTVDFENAVTLLGITPEEEHDNYDTIGGFIMGNLGRIPQLGDSFMYDNMRFEVTELGDKRPGKIKAVRLKNDEMQPDGSNE